MFWALFVLTFSSRLELMTAFCNKCNIQLASFTPTVPTLPVGSPVKIVFDLSIKNFETGNGANKRINKVNNPNENYKLTLFYSDFDVSAVGIGSNSVTQVPGTTTTTAILKPGGARHVGLNQQAELKAKGEATLTVPAGECSLTNFVCLFVEPGTGADWSDDTAMNNYLCQNVKGSVTSCGIDIIGTNFAMNAGNPLAKQGVATTLGFDIRVKNNAPAGTGINIAAAAGPNYAVDLYFAQGDIAANPTATKTAAFPASTTADLTVGLAQGASTSTLPMTVSATVPATDCSKYTWVCACVKTGTAAAYTDLNTNNNCQCMSSAGLISCSPDVNIVSVTPTGAAVIDDYTPLAGAANFGFDVKINNVGIPGGGQDIAPATGINRNFQLSLKLTDVDLGAGGTDTLSLPAGNIVLTQPGTAQLQVGLTAGGPGAADRKDLSATAQMTIPTAQCKSVKFLCATVSQAPTSTYATETKLANNVKCIDLVATGKRNCKPTFDNLDKSKDVPELSSGEIYDVDASDPDSNTLTYSLAAGTPSIFTINSANGKISLTTPVDFEAGTVQYKLTTYADDGKGGTATGTLTVNIIDVNEPPVLTPSATAVNVGEHTLGNIGVTITKADPDVSNGQGITYSIQKPAGAPFAVDAGGNIKVVAPGLDYLKPASHKWVLEIIGVDSGSPAPVVRTGTTVVTVNVQDEPDPPTITGMPASVSIKEDVKGGPKEIFKVVATDPDGSPLTYVLQPSPLDGKFRLDPADNTKIQYIANPNFNYEKQKQYKLTVFVMDGVTQAAMGELTVNIIDVPEKPRFLNLPNKAFIPENQFYGCQIFEVSAVDDENDPIDIKMEDVFHHDSGRKKFEIDKWRYVRTTYNNCLNHETDPYYIANITACDKTGCAIANLTIYVEDWIEPPIFNPQFYTLVLKESQSTTTRLPIDTTRLVSDPDYKDTLTCSKAQSTYSSFVRVTGGCAVFLDKGLDYDRHNPPHHFTVDICASDKKGLKTCLLLHIHVTNVDDETPYFTPASYTEKIFENATAQTVVTTMTCFDMDLGVYGEVKTWIDPSNVIAHRDFEVKLLNRTHQQRLAHKSLIELRVRNRLDIEKYSTVTFNVLAASPSRTGTAVVTIHIGNVNDNRPKWTKTFYNWETSIYRDPGHVIGTVHGYDQDIIYNRVHYYLVKDSFEFRLEAIRGDVTHRILPILPAYHRYVLRAYIKDNDPSRSQGGVATIRIDTYIDKDVLTNWTSCNSVAHYKNEANQQLFLDGLRKMCYPCVPRIHDVVDNGDGKARFLLYFLTNDTTEYHRNVELVKHYISPEHTMANFTTDLVERPHDFVKNASSEIARDCIEKITWFRYPDPKLNWILDTIEGNVVLGILMSIGLASLLTALICAMQKAAHYRTNYGWDEPMKREKSIVSKSDVQVVTDDPNVMDFRYKDKPLAANPTHEDAEADLPGTPTPPASESAGSRPSSSNGNSEVPSRPPPAGRAPPASRR